MSRVPAHASGRLFQKPVQKGLRGEISVDILRMTAARTKTPACGVGRCALSANRQQCCIQYLPARTTLGLHPPAKPTGSGMVEASSSAEPESVPALPPLAGPPPTPLDATDGCTGAPPCRVAAEAAAPANSHGPICTRSAVEARRSDLGR